MKFVFAFFMIIFLASPAFASCYTMREAEAEQGIRIHSELMVIGLNCQHLGPRGQKNLYQQYKEFTARHGALLRGYETTLMNHFRKEGRNAEFEINQMRTDFANKISRDAAVMRPDAFCATYSSRIDRAGRMNEQAVRKWAATIFQGFPTTRPLCAN
jgi:hypothetical protein